MPAGLFLAKIIIGRKKAISLCWLMSLQSGCICGLYPGDSMILSQSLLNGHTFSGDFACNRTTLKSLVMFHEIAFISQRSRQLIKRYYKEKSTIVTFNTLYGTEFIYFQQLRIKLSLSLFLCFVFWIFSTMHSRQVQSRYNI